MFEASPHIIFTVGTNRSVITDKAESRQPESFLISVKEDIRCKYFKTYYIQL